MIAKISLLASVLYIALCLAGFGYFIYKYRAEIKKVEDKKSAYTFTYLILAMISGVCILGYSLLLYSDHASIDAMNLINCMDPMWHLMIGRYTNCATLELAKRIGMHQVTDQHIFLCIWLVTLIAEIFIIGTSIVKRLNLDTKLKNAAVYLIVSIAFVNVFYNELMLFPEMAMTFIFTNLSLALSVYFALSDLKFVIKWSASTVFLLISMGAYQSFIGIYVAFVLIGIFFKYKDQTKKRYTEGITSLVIGAGCCVFNLVFMSVLIKTGVMSYSGRGATSSIDLILNNIKSIILFQPRLWKSADGLLMDYSMFIMISVVFVMWCLAVHKYKLEQKLYCIALFAISYFVVFVPHIPEEIMDLSPRSNIAFWSFVSIAMLFVLSEYIGKLQKQTVFKVFMSLVCVFVVLNVTTMQDMTANAEKTNAIDYSEAEQFANKIRKYESENDITVNYIAIVYDKNPSPKVNGTRYTQGFLGERSLSHFYPGRLLIQHYLGHELQMTNTDDAIVREYAQKDWTSFNPDEQIFFINDIAYYVLY